LTGFDKIFQVVTDDQALMHSLAAVETGAELFALVLALAQDRGIEVETAQLAEIVRANRRAWLERWLAI